MAETPGGKGKASTGEIINLDLSYGFLMTDPMSGIGKNVSFDLCLNGKYGMC